MTQMFKAVGSIVMRGDRWELESTDTHRNCPGQVYCYLRSATRRNGLYWKVLGCWLPAAVVDAHFKITREKFHT